MATTDCRTLHVYRLPVYQKRTIDINNHVSSPHARPSSFNRTSLASGRRHSTPPGSALHIVDTHSPPPNTFIKYYYPPTRPAGMNKEQNPLSDPIKSPPRPTSLVKLRRQEDRNVRMVTTPTSINSVTDIILPIAKKNRNTIVDTPTSVASDIQSMNRNVSAAKRGKAIALDFERDISLSNDDSGEHHPERRVVNKNQSDGIMANVLVDFPVVIFVIGIVVVHFVVGLYVFSPDWLYLLQ